MSASVRAIHHVTLVTGNLDRAIAFYTNVLGLTPIDRPDYDFQGAWYRVGDIEIHLLAAREAQGVSQRHIAFEVDDFDALLETISSHRIRIAGGPGVREHNSRRFVFCKDPDGNLLEFNSPA